MTLFLFGCKRCLCEFISTDEVKTNDKLIGMCKCPQCGSKCESEDVYEDYELE